MTVLAVNAGSSTLKFALHPVAEHRVLPAMLSGAIDGLALGGRLQLGWRSGGESFLEPLDGSDGDPFATALRALQRVLTRASAGRDLQAVAHRVVHGGELFRSSVQVDDEVLAALGALEPLAPLHQPHNLEGIRAFRRFAPELPQVACFDTAFHASVPAEEHLFALPPEFAGQGIRRFGFHGLSYQYVMAKLHQFSQRSMNHVVMAHLGNGASLCGALKGESRATTMGFSALDGLMMGTRSGSIDAGVLLHLLAKGWDRARLQDLLYCRSGLLGVSGLSGDLRELRASDADRARTAIRMFTHRVVRETGAMTACLGGLDVLAFTGGIGENDCRLRADVCERLAYLGVALDHEANTLFAGGSPARLDAIGSAVEVWVVPTDEGRVAAQAAVDLLREA